MSFIEIRSALMIIQQTNVFSFVKNPIVLCRIDGKQYSGGKRFSFLVLLLTHGLKV